MAAPRLYGLNPDELGETQNCKTGSECPRRTSRLATQRLGADYRQLRRDLISGHRPIGDLIHRDRIETFREVLEVGREPAGQVGRYFDLEPEAPMFFRTYRIFSAGQRIAAIRERFPADAPF